MQVNWQPKWFCSSKLYGQRWGWGCPGQKQEAGKSLDYLHFKFLAVHAHCSGHCSHSLQLRTLFTLIAIQDIVDTDCNSGHRHWAGILGEVGRGHCAPSKWTSIDLISYQMSTIRNTKPYYCQPLHYIQTFSPTYWLYYMEPRETINLGVHYIVIFGFDNITVKPTFVLKKNWVAESWFYGNFPWF